MLACDRCGAKAFWAFTGRNGFLLLCGHHAAVHASSLRAQGFSQNVITEDRIGAPA